MARGVAQMQRWLAEGRGEGHGIAYKPWLHVQDVMSIGRAHKIPGIKICRMHHVLSDLEAACLLVLEFQRNVLDIREQFPLLPTELSQRAAASLSIRHPTYRGTAVPLVLTSDFCVDVQTAAGVRVMETAIAVKYVQGLRERRVRELLAIERETNRLAGRNWMLFTEISVPSAVVRNLWWLRRGTAPAGAEDDDVIRDLCQALHGLNSPNRSLDSLIGAVSSHLHVSDADGLRLFRFAAWHQALIIRLDVEISLRQPLTLAECYQVPLQLSDAADPGPESH